MLHWIAAHELLVRVLATPAGLVVAVLIAAAALRGSYRPRHAAWLPRHKATGAGVAR